MKIADIQIIPIRPRLAARYADREIWFEGIDRRTIFKVLTDSGLVGYGDHRLGAPSRESVASLIGRDPFDFINNHLDPGLGGALYFLSSTAGSSLGSLVTGLVKPMWSFQVLGMVMTAAMVAVFALAALFLPPGSTPSTPRSGGSGTGLWSAYRPRSGRCSCWWVCVCPSPVSGAWHPTSCRYW